MRVTRVDSDGNKATLRCIVTGYSTRAHLLRVRFIQRPLTEGLFRDWAEVVTQEGSLLRTFFNIDRTEGGPTSSSNDPRPMGVPANVGNTPHGPRVTDDEHLPGTAYDDELPVVWLDDWDYMPLPHQQPNELGINANDWNKEVQQFVIEAHLLHPQIVEVDDEVQDED